MHKVKIFNHALSEAMIIQNLLYLSKFCQPCPLRAYPLVRKMSYLNSDGLIPDSPGKPRFGKVKIILMVC